MAAHFMTVPGAIPPTTLVRHRQESATTYDEAVAFLDAHIGLGMRPGLERIAALVDLMAAPHTGYPIIHVAGTNGKTSTTLIAGALIGAHGLSYGTYTSPHLEAIEGRYGIDGRTATPEEFAAVIADIVPFVDLLEARIGERATYFELTTAAAFAFFSERAVGAAVVEVGLGGRLDATNVVDGAVAVVTGIDLEHTEYLGSTVAEVAAEKLAIAKAGGILVTGPLPPEAEAVAEQRAADSALVWRRYDRDYRVTGAVQAVGGWLVDIDTDHGSHRDVPLMLHGRHQTINLAVAVVAVEELFGRRLSDDAVREAAASARVPGRLEVIGRHPLLVLDGAHNPAGMVVLAESIGEEFPDQPWHLVFGVMADKDVDAMFDALRGRIGEAYFVAAADTPRAMPVKDLADRARSRLGVPVHEADSVRAGVEEAIDAAGGEGSVLVTGSLYVVGEARRFLVDEPITIQPPATRRNGWQSNEPS